MGIHIPAKVTSKGQVTIPKEIRDRSRIEAGTTVYFDVDETGRITLVPKTLTVRDLAQILPKPERPLTDEEIDAAVGKALRDRLDRSRD